MDDIIFLSIEEVVVIHERMIEIGGGASGIRDIELLHSALGRPKASFSGEYLYPDILHMGSAILQSLVKNYPFVDGNKRTAFFATLRFFDKNEMQFIFDEVEIVEFMVRVDVENLSVQEITNWFEKRLMKQ
ncbi:MAG: Toxin Doc [Microgenomates bacterium OLB23]|nr:MAG: Toxin Doc [Microgenomates bacterium OLB23]